MWFILKNDSYKGFLIVSKGIDSGAIDLMLIVYMCGFTIKFFLKRMLMYNYGD